MKLNNVINGEKKVPIDVKITQNPYNGDVSLFIRSDKETSEVNVEYHMIRVLYEYGKIVRETNKVGEEND